jgi:dTDP-4-dehydrorhamnose 3,5-epimerase-like enzyme
MIKYKIPRFSDNRGSLSPVPIYLEGTKQLNITRSTQGVIRGMHTQEKPFEQAKQLIVLNGTIDDVIINLTTKELKWFRLGENDSLLIPEGYLHGFEVLSKEATVLYVVNKPYKPSKEVSVNPLTIPYQWKTLNPILSDKDKEGVNYSNFIKGYQKK